MGILLEQCSGLLSGQLQQFLVSHDVANEKQGLARLAQTQEVPGAPKFEVSLSD